jgi:hypothetical protein
MNTKTIITATAMLLTLSGFAAPAFADPVKEFAGSRAEVREFCTAEGRTLLEGGAYSLCITPVSDVVCFDGGICSSNDLRLVIAQGFPESVTDVAWTTIR